MVIANLLQSSVKRGAELLTEMLGKVPGLEAVFCCNDDLALGALFECQRRGIRVPEDLSIIGFNDLDFCASAYPALSSVAIPRYEMARLAAEMVLEIIRGSGTRPKQTRIDLGFEIVSRGSTTKRVRAPVRSPRTARVAAK
jgi:LacI family gluconate utilization system Gnt-I transcriptional repressor